MGIETLFSVGGSLLGAVLSKVASGGGDKSTPAAVQPAQLPPQPQATKLPERNLYRDENATAAARTGLASTMRTPPGGIDPAGLLLGRSLLSGGDTLG